ncbi:MAG TPA: DEAD/DEAH box helicase [Candidatus Saccharimonadales bacterium]|nr:DEAD/DEAH box helicase [Candidatus Saccharimonadales bacterium]
MRNNSRSSFSRPSDRRGPGNNSGGNGGGFRRNGRPVNYGPQRRSGGNRNGGTYINPEKFVNKAVAPAEEIAYEPTHMFADFKVSDIIRRNIEQAGYTTPTAIQDGAIPAIIEGRDVIGLANTGTGKTAAFVIPTLERIKDTQNRPAVLIMAPTRELAYQIDDEFRKFSRGLRLYSALIVGGMNIARQISDVKRGPHVIIGTPGRLKDLVKRGVLKLQNVEVVVLDEADQMLDMGFINDIRFLIGELPEKRQSLCFSATITPPIQQLLSTLLVDPVTVSVRTAETSEHVEQDVIRTQGKEHKIEVLQELLAKPDFEKVLVFGQTKWSVQRLADELTKNGFPSEAIHGNKSQPQRKRALQNFKDDRVKVLVATDVAARGLDIPNVSHVINFDQPNTYQDYVHRIGRTGRGGKRGSALTFIER